MLLYVQNKCSDQGRHAKHDIASNRRLIDMRDPTGEASNEEFDDVALAVANGGETGRARLVVHIDHRRRRLIKPLTGMSVTRSEFVSIH